ncbi:MAG: hypothetical protein GF383_10125 [Candidatus Lokiarchaeota archaeon]|nr:hypothetical protein [Candidatus Lokiarchaeota archaeon]MBD3340922.1 hypothetical protein [Candidatus Lokiarchaeota archaeon]
MEWLIIVAVFLIVFLGELGDKTQLIVFNLTLEYEKKYKVGIGATIGFAAIVTLGVFIGEVVVIFVPILLISLISGGIFLIIGFLELINAKKLYKEKQGVKQNEQIDERIELNRSIAVDNENSSFLKKIKKNPYIAGFGSIFIMELGDKTQLLTITLASIYDSPILVWLGAFFALVSLAWIGVFFGKFIAERVPKFHLKLVSSMIFILIGILILITSFLPIYI